MIQTILLGFGGLLVIATWLFAYKPAQLDTARDRLFDLRDITLRNFFIENNYGLEHDSYRLLRKLINSHLRYTEKMSLLEIISTAVFMKSNTEVYNDIRNKIDVKFKTDDEIINEFSKEIRIKAFQIMLVFLVSTSAPMLFISLLVAPFVVLREVCLSIFKVTSVECKRAFLSVSAFKEEIKFIANSILSFNWERFFSLICKPISAALIMVMAQVTPAHARVNQSVVEECALHCNQQS